VLGSAVASLDVLEELIGKIYIGVFNG